MRPERVYVMAGNAFAISDGQGDIIVDPHDPIGYFAFDTRFLSHWVLKVDGERLNALSRDDMTYFETRFFLVPGAASHYVDTDVSLIRHRSIDESFQERIIVLNHSAEPAEFTVRLDVGSDFADTSEIQQPRTRDVSVVADSERRQLRFRYTRDRFVRQTVVTSTAPVDVDEHGLTYHIRIEPEGEWVTDLHVATHIEGAGGRDLRAGLEEHREHVRRTMREDLREWLDRAPLLVSERPELTATYRQCLVDLAALRYVPLVKSGMVPVGGLPWGMALYGRDAIITCLQTLAFLPELARSTLYSLSTLQGDRLDDEHDEEPGKIVAELRYGEAAAFGEEPTALYYGAADTTPLFVVLLDEYERWSGDADLVRELRHPARMALDWIDEYGDLTGDGYLRYLRRSNRKGWVNQGWRNSPDAIAYADGRLPGQPRATCELQGYAYDAKRRGARLAREFWGEPEYADRLEREAAELKRRFNNDFWLPQTEYYALALEPDGTPVDALSSNIGHLLWSGIVEEERARALAAHLVGPDLFSGWGVRTFAAGQHRYNPVGSHLGAVWPSDNALIVAGLRNYRCDAEAARIASGIFDMACTLGGSVPEVIAGYEREVTRYPIQLPAAGRPQAWSSGGLLMLLATLLGLRPSGENLLVSPVLPSGFGRIELLDIPGRWGHSDAYGRDRGNLRARRPRMR
ncbi:glycogen debranching N-terminal domain-containing protein [Micromonospora sp. NPDC005367]|uniref:amylo-alpha-1,6-glucosidase n=1 Tax=Micromonospora sp. NPDC005367 TaxID=3155590 RepID=UPI0033B10F53